MNLRTRLISPVLLASLLASCASHPGPRAVIHRDGLVGRSGGDGEAGDGQTEAAGAVRKQALQAPEIDPTPVIRRGTGQVINREAAGAPVPNIGGTTGEVQFNFQGEPLHAVVQAVLGDMLQQNYVIAPGVQGTVTYSTARPVSPAEALSVLEMILGWNNAKMIWQDGRYSIVAADAPLGGAVAPRIGPASSARGFESRVVPLRYISAEEMKKILEPYARPNAIVNADAGRNVITVAGTRSELENYLRTIQTFDVDWMSSMSVGVFPLQSSKAGKVVADLEKVFGSQSKSPVAGMFRFMPLDAANAVMVITSQADYLDNIQDWLSRIDGAGDGVALRSYELKYITAKRLAEQLAQVFGGRSSSGGGDGSAALMPGAEASVIGDGDVQGQADGDSAGNGFAANGATTDFNAGGGTVGSGGAGGGGGSLSLGRREGGNTSVSFEVDGSQVGVAAVEETNSVLVRSSAPAWRSIKQVIEKLDVMPMQVHIEAQVAEVQLNGELQYGVNWYLERAATDWGFDDVSPSRADNPDFPDKWSTVAGAINPVAADGSGRGYGGLSWMLVKRGAGAIISALDQVTDVRMLQTPSIMVRNNEEATLNVGDRVPIASTSVNPLSGADVSYSQVQYLDTGTILKIRPRVTKEGTVFVDVVQEISNADYINTTANQPNPTISTRKAKTTAIMQSGDTTMIAGLINDRHSRGSNGIPGLSRIPVVGGLFGKQGSRKTRTEVIIFLTAKIIGDPKEARDLTDEYSRRFRAMEPIDKKSSR